MYLKLLDFKFDPNQFTSRTTIPPPVAITIRTFEDSCLRTSVCRDTNLWNHSFREKQMISLGNKIEEYLITSFKRPHDLWDQMNQRLHLKIFTSSWRTNQSQCIRNFMCSLETKYRNSRSLSQYYIVRHKCS